jgi:trans-aconitate 2-methyltransferase
LVPADLLFARYVLTHLPDPEARLRDWSRQSHPGGIVAVEDNAGIDTSNPAFETYLDIAGKVKGNRWSAGVPSGS